METGLLLGLKARVMAAQGASPGLDHHQKKLLGSMGDPISLDRPWSPKDRRIQRFLVGFVYPGLAPWAIITRPFRAQDDCYRRFWLHSAKQIRLFQETASPWSWCKLSSFRLSRMARPPLDCYDSLLHGSAAVRGWVAECKTVARGCLL